MRLRTFLVLSFLSFGLFATVSLVSARLPFPMSKQAVAGKRVWQKHNCVSCHTLFGNGGYAGDDLTLVTAEHAPSYLVNYLVEPPVMRPNKLTHHPGLNKAEAENLVQYLDYVRCIPTLGWPPHKDAGKNL